jgi:hypothetical protein
MPITTTNSEYDKRVRQWQRCQDAIDGSDAIKARGEVYLPQLSGQTADEYRAYQQRALWYGASARTVERSPVRSCARSLRWKRRRCWRNI